MNITLRLFLLILFTGPCFGQSIPDESSKSSIAQRVGLTDIKIVYSRPNIREREIWGNLVAYNSIWRTGANYPTLITFPDTTMIEQKHLVLPGTYALYTIPRESNWTVIFSKNTKLWGAFGYDQKDDALRFEVQPLRSEFHETFTICFENVSTTKAAIALQWENLKISFLVEALVTHKILNNIQLSIDHGGNDWRIYWKGSKFILDNQLDLNQAKKWINSSLEIEKNWMNLWTQAEISAHEKDFQKAILYGTLALKKGIAAGEYFFYKQWYELKINSWKKEQIMSND